MSRPRCASRQEEIFGPVLAVLPARNSITRSRSPTASVSACRPAICTRSLTSAYEFINRIEAGLVMVNLPSAGVEYHVPFGGSKALVDGHARAGPRRDRFLQRDADGLHQVLIAPPERSGSRRGSGTPRSLTIMKLYRTASGIVVERDGSCWLVEASLGRLMSIATTGALLARVSQNRRRRAQAPRRPLCAPPIGSQEVWAAGVTYFRSRTARMEEAKSAGGGDFYDRVYEAARPELFFKATPHRGRAAPATGSASAAMRAGTCPSRNSRSWHQRARHASSATRSATT